MRADGPSDGGGEGRERTDVLIVGAGPAGLALAIALRRAGVDHLIVDAAERGQNTSRAVVIHAHTLETLEAIGMAEPLEKAGLAVARFSVRDRDRTLLRASFAGLPSRYRHMLAIPQSATEALLEARLAELGGVVHRGVAARGATSVPGGAAVRVADASGERTIRARYVVGADGMRSAIREAAGIAFPGTDEAESFVLADVRMDWPPGEAEVALFLSPDGLVVVAPLPDGAFRIVATLDDAPERPTLADVGRLLDARCLAGTRVREVVWSSRFRVHHRLAATYRRGPFALIGDAAHVHSPAGGQGMNTGLVDAIVLGDALTRVLRDGAPDSTLDDYARVRRPAAERVLALAARLTRMAVIRSPVGRRLRNLALRGLGRAPAFVRRLTLDLSGLSRRGYVLPPPVSPPSPPARRSSTR